MQHGVPKKLTLENLRTIRLETPKVNKTGAQFSSPRPDHSVINQLSILMIRAVDGVPFAFMAKSM